MWASFEGSRAMQGQAVISGRKARIAHRIRSPGQRLGFCARDIGQSSLGLDPLRGRIDCISAKKPWVCRFD